MNDNADTLGRRKKWSLAGLLFTAAYVGFFLGVAPDNEAVSVLLDWIGSLAMIFLLFGWCYADAQQRGFFLTRGMKICLVLFSYLAFPWYVFRSRGMGGFKTLGLALCFAVALLITGVVAGLGGYGVATAFRGMRGY